jgi:prephenate dehydrogenase
VQLRALSEEPPKIVVMKSLRDSTVAIVGMGLMGGSFALALREKKACHKIIATDSDPGTRAQAKERGFDTHGELDAIANSDVVILATPVRTIIEQLPRVGQVAKPGAIIIDLGSTKHEIVSVMEKLPENLQPIGGHPMCGKETFGFDAADANLFQNAVFTFTPLSRTSRETAAFALSLAGCLDARPLILDAERHDKLVAIASHLPFALSTTLMLAALEFASEEDLLFELTASGFRDTSRLAASDTTMMLDILMTNQTNVADAVRKYSERLSSLANLIDNQDEKSLRKLLESAAQKRRSI